ncbi:hypothetical protein LB559_16150 [Mesorhizobium sp. BR1-1-3]|uniref:hypothetical protein n=1 Tax=Mesorhizobium sp. BR1-1-3 TaxID=2876651 RepID=UPI001CD18637|nr:hypothetical protein [Mesorhizobium sp. BR1-1-3]MBZ9889459.1 hypothetical protein [Mesorhizobium sp. BR1-1-3]
MEIILAIVGILICVGLANVVFSMFGDAREDARNRRRLKRIEQRKAQHQRAPRGS